MLRIETGLSGKHNERRKTMGRRSRGMFFARVLRSRCPSGIGGRRESRAPDAPVDPVRRSTRASHAPKRMGKDYRYSRDSPAFPTQWLYGLLRALPGERPFLPPSLHGPYQQLGARVAAPEPHDFTGRRGRLAGEGSPDAATAHRHPCQRTVAIMMRPSGGTGWA